VHQQEVTTNEKGTAEQAFTMEAGAFQVTFETTDPAGEKVSAQSTFLVIDPVATTFPIKIPDFFAVEKTTVQPGETFTALWGTGYDTGSAYIEVFHRQELVDAFWTDKDSTQKKIEIPIEEKHRGGLQVIVTYVRENRMYSHPTRVDVPWENKRLQVKWEHFVSKLQPGGKETWTAVVTGPDAESSAIEMVAAMYDSSLDQFFAHQWSEGLGSFYKDRLNRSIQYSNRRVVLDRMGRFRIGTQRGETVLYRRYADGVGLKGYWGYQRYSRLQDEADFSYEDQPRGMSQAMPMRAMAKSSKTPPAPVVDGGFVTAGDQAAAGGEQEKAGGEGGGPDLTQVSIRKNLQETAFFYPNLIADDEGRIKIEFEVPEALTTWKFMGLTHDGELRTGLLTDEMTTSKDLIVQPNPPRFLREGDQLYFSVKVTNRSDKAQTGIVQLQLNNAFDESSVDEAFGNGDSKKPFEVPANESRSYHWKLNVPDYVGAVTYKVVGASDTVSDGEEGMLPVLSKLILVTESLPLPIRGNQTRTFTFEELEKMDRSDSLKNQSLTVQMTSNPSWYAVMALPYLMEYPHQCSEQTFFRSVARNRRAEKSA